VIVPDAVVFDCDGVLVDSEPHSVAAWEAVLAELRHPADRAAIDACVGLGFSATRDHLAAIAPLPAAEIVWPRLIGALRSSFDAGFHVFDDALAVVDAVARAGLPMAVASSSPRERLDLTLDRAGLRERFAVSVAGDEVSDPKPAPDVFRRALELLGIAGGSRVAIEDTAIGVKAAQAAGFDHVVAVVRDEATRAALESSGAHVVDRLLPVHIGL
jgi:beta-phosphoglucomutase-like phosphatase (HAD superfamily)